ncbi:MAG: NADH:flavin oxidoreductase/NADH oxidase [Pseudomonadota bacterium]
MSALFSPFALRGVTFKNRVAVSPMSQYRAKGGYANDWHLVHLGRFALGGAGLVYAEATAVEDRGRRTHGDLGIWEDGQIEPLARVTRFIAAEGAVPGIQLGHAGRKASERRPWHGESPVNEEDTKLRDEPPWETIGPSALPFAEPWPLPAEMSEDDIQGVIDAFGQAARRSKDAGFRIIEVYAAHGFLLHQFYSPIANQRTDRWGGSLENRCRLSIEVARAIRAHWPEDLPLAFRLSATDWMEGGWTPEETVELARWLNEAGVDMIDCSTGGIGGMGGRERPSLMPLSENFQVPFAAQVRNQTGVPSMAVGLIWDAEAAERIIANGDADMVALARELLDHPNWPLQAMATLGADERFNAWPPEFGWWLDKRERVCTKLGLR